MLMCVLDELRTTILHRTYNNLFKCESKKRISIIAHAQDNNKNKNIAIKNMNTKWRNEVDCAFVLTFVSIELVCSDSISQRSGYREQVRRRQYILRYNTRRALGIFYNKRNQLIRVNKLFFILFCIFMCSMPFFLIQFRFRIFFMHLRVHDVCVVFFLHRRRRRHNFARTLSTSSMAIKMNWLGTVHIST